jgi:hypothetical protein
MTGRSFQIGALIVGFLGVSLLIWQVYRSWRSGEFNLRAVAIETAQRNNTPVAPDGFLDSKVIFGRTKGSDLMLPIESVQRASAPFLDTIVLDDPGVLERFLTREKRINRPFEQPRR